MITLLPVAGFFIWKIFSQPLPLPEQQAENTSQQPAGETAKMAFPELHVGGETIPPADLEWEYSMHTTLPQFVANDEHFGLPKAAPDSNEPPLQAQDSIDLRERIIGSVIERKILFHYIKEKAVGFNLDDPARFQKCLSQLKDSSESNKEFFSHQRNHDRLKTKLCEEDLIRQYLNETIFKPLSIQSDEVTAYYRKHEKNYKKPLRIVLRQVVLADEDKANEIRKTIKPSNFAQLAKAHSITPEAENGGLIGPFSKEQLPTLFDIVFSMGIGEISGIVKSEYGYHIMMPVERLAPQTQSIAEVTAAIKAELLRAKQLEAYQKWFKLAMNSVSVSSPNSGENP
jgi:peptidyl-prolyl cis-trans isomerase C